MQSTVLLLQCTMPSRGSRDGVRVAERIKPFKNWCLFSLLQQGLHVKTTPFTPIFAISPSYLTDGAQVVRAQPTGKPGDGAGAQLFVVIKPREWSPGKFLDAVPCSSPSSEPKSRDIGGQIVEEHQCGEMDLSLS